VSRHHARSGLLEDGDDGPERFLDELISLLEAHAIRYCVVGGQAVNAYAERS
jgi:hypothetical protein